MGAPSTVVLIDDAGVVANVDAAAVETVVVVGSFLVALIVALVASVITVSSFLIEAWL